MCPSLGYSIESTLVLKIGPTLSKSVGRTLRGNGWTNQCHDNTGRHPVLSSRQPQRTKFHQTWFQSCIFVSSHMTRTSFWQKIKKGSPLTAGFEEIFVRVNHKNELYFSIISFQNGANRVYVSEINIVVFKR